MEHPGFVLWFTGLSGAGKTTISLALIPKLQERGVKIEDFRIDNVPARVKRLGDLWKPLLEKQRRFKLEVYLQQLVLGLRSFGLCSWLEVN